MCREIIEIDHFHFMDIWKWYGESSRFASADKEEKENARNIRSRRDSY